MQISKHDEHGRPYIEICEGYVMKLETDELSEEYKEKARKELRETPENVEKGLKELRELLAGEFDVLRCFNKKLTSLNVLLLIIKIPFVSYAIIFEVIFGKESKTKMTFLKDLEKSRHTKIN